MGFKENSEILDVGKVLTQKLQNKRVLQRKQDLQIGKLSDESTSGFITDL